MSDKNSCPHTRDTTLAVLQAAAADHNACAACTGTAGLYLAAMCAHLDLHDDRVGFLKVAGEVWDDMLRQGVVEEKPQEAATPAGDLN